MYRIPIMTTIPSPSVSLERVLPYSQGKSSIASIISIPLRSVRLGSIPISIAAFYCTLPVSATIMNMYMVILHRGGLMVIVKDRIRCIYAVGDDATSIDGLESEQVLRTPEYPSVLPRYSVRRLYKACAGQKGLRVTRPASLCLTK